MLPPDRLQLARSAAPADEGELRSYLCPACGTPRRRSELMLGIHFDFCDAKRYELPGAPRCGTSIVAVAGADGGVVAYAITAAERERIAPLVRRLVAEERRRVADATLRIVREVLEPQRRSA